MSPWIKRLHVFPLDFPWAGLFSQDICRIKQHSNVIHRLNKLR
uniref:Uncharacterized protein n=1 Tax=Anguilla anguilla TaxID=7936 RepID=A0A0E9S9G3_ANGAN